MRQNEQMKTNTKRLLLSVVAVCISITIAATAIFAWFVSTEKSNINTFSLNVKSQFVGGTAIQSYAISTITKSETQNTYNLATADNQPVVLYTMPSFDEHGIVLNKYQPALAINIKFTAYDNIMVAVMANATEGLVSVGVANWMSNCIQFDFAAYDAQNLTLATNKAPTAFVSITQEQLSKTNQIELYRQPADQGLVSLWFIVEYNRDVLLELHKINKNLEANLIAYANDITFTIDAV